MIIKARFSTLCALGLSALAMGCDGSSVQDSTGSAGSQHGSGANPNLSLPSYQYRPDGTGINNNVTAVGTTDLTVDYSLALRTAAIKLRGDLPTMAEIKRLSAAVKANLSDGSENDPSFVYRDIVKSFINDSPRFSRQMVVFWRNQLRMGGTLMGDLADLPLTAANKRTVSLETAPTLLGRLAAEGKDMRLAFTQTTNNCPMYNAATGVFTDGNCFTGAAVAGSNTATNMGNNIPEGQQAGVLTNPGFMAQYYSNFAFRRARLVNEVFACTRYPAEYSSKPQVIGSALYSSPWPTNSVTNADQPPTYATPRRVQQMAQGVTLTTQTKEYVDFSLQAGCMGCHTSLNRRAPLFAAFDSVGFMNTANMWMVHSPVTDAPFSQIQDYLPAGNDTPSWKFGVPTPDLKSFGKAMADDTQVARCFMIRAWNDAYSRDDVVNDLALVPDSVIEEMTQYFIANNYNMKMAIEKLYTDPNFVRF